MEVLPHPQHTLDVPYPACWWVTPNPESEGSKQPPLSLLFVLTSPLCLLSCFLCEFLPHFTSGKARARREWRVPAALLSFIPLELFQECCSMGF